MADFTSDLQSFKHSFSFFDNIDFPNPMESVNQFAELNPCLTDNSVMNYQSFFPSSIDNLFSNQAQAIVPAGGNLQMSSVSVVQPILTAKTETFHETSKRKALDESKTSSGNYSSSSSPQVSESGNKTRRKRAKRNEKELEEKPKEVVHVRARRGHATDSHSLAERVRRGKINERLKCLKDIVPGCYETMGMAVMLDEIINYVQSLQNQIEFLSMKLSTASTYHDFNSDSDAMEKKLLLSQLESSIIFYKGLTAPSVPKLP